MESQSDWLKAKIVHFKARPKLTLENHVLVPFPLRTSFLGENFSVTHISRFLLGLSYKVFRLAPNIPELQPWPDREPLPHRFKVK